MTASHTEPSVLLKSEAIRKVMRAPVKKIVHAVKVDKASKKPAPANTMAVRASTMKATGLLPNQVSFLLGFSAH